MCALLMSPYSHCSCVQVCVVLMSCSPVPLFMGPIEQMIHQFPGVLLRGPIACYLGFKSLRKYIYDGYLML